MLLLRLIMQILFHYKKFINHFLISVTANVYNDEFLLDYKTYW